MRHAAIRASLDAADRFMLGCCMQAAGLGNIQAPPLSPTACSPAATREALLQFYAETGGPTWRNASGWPGRQNSNTRPAGGALFDHCAWAGVVCCSSALPCMSRGTLSDLVQCDCMPGTLRALALTGNNVSVLT